MARVVVLGGGLGGVVAANRLRKRLSREHTVTLVERQPLVSFPPAFLRVMDGRRSGEAITRDLRRLGRRGIEVVPASVTGVDTATRVVRTDGAASVGYDYLVIALGADLLPAATPGLAEHSHNLYSLAGNESMRDALAGFGGGRILVTVAGLPYKCPAAPYEAAFLVDALLRRRGVRGSCAISLVVPEPAPLPVAGPIVGEQVEALLLERDIEYVPATQLQAVESTGASFADGTTREFDLLASVPAHGAPAALGDSGLVNEGGWVTVDRTTLETSAADVFALGDVTAIPLGEGRMLPKAGVFAHGEAEAVAQTIAARIRDRGEEGAFDGHGSCFVEVGNGRAAYASGDFYSPDADPVSLRGPGRRWLWQKSLFERYWLWRWY